MMLPVLPIFGRQSLVMDHEQVLRVLLLSGFGEVERAGEQHRATYGLSTMSVVYFSDSALAVPIPHKYR